MHAETMQAEQIPTTADELGRAPRWQCGLGQLPGDLVTQHEKMPTNPKRLKHAPSRVCGLRCSLGRTFQSGGPQVSGGDMIERPGHLGRVAEVFDIPESTSRAEKTPRIAEKSAERPR